MKIVLIGTGNTATVLGHKLKDAGHTILQVFGRSSGTTETLAAALAASPVFEPQQISPEADVYIIAVSDNAIEETASKLSLPPTAIVVHTAAAVSLSVLKNVSPNFGVFYPLQTLKKGSALPQQVPILIEASNTKTGAVLETLGNTISEEVVFLDGEKRTKLHLAAVFCNNFVNHLYALSEAYCLEEGIDFNLLKPLIVETATRVQSMPAAEAQTGPAPRRDGGTIEKHLALLNNHPQLANLYTVLTKSIQDHC